MPRECTSPRHPRPLKRSIPNRAGAPMLEQLGACAGACGPEPLESRTHLAVNTSLPLVILAVADADAAERDANQGRFTITRFGSVDAPLRVTFQIQGGATPGADYLGLSGAATIPAGRRAVSLPIIPIDDLEVEGPETVRIILSADPSYRLDDANVLNRNLAITIRDNDALPLVTLATPDSTATEGAADTAMFTVRRTGSAALPLTVDFRISGSATPGVDYQSFTSSVTIQPGKRAAFIPVRAFTDGAFEGREVVRLTLLTSQTNTYALSQTEPARVKRPVFIEDRPLVSLIVTDPIASSEPDDTAEFTVMRTGPVNQPLQISYLLEGTAIPGTDYIRPSQFITIPAGESFTHVTIRGTGALLSTVSKTVRLTLRSLPTYNLNYNLTSSLSMYITIIDDTVPPGV